MSINVDRSVKKTNKPAGRDAADTPKWLARPHQVPDRPAEAPLRRQGVTVAVLLSLLVQLGDVDLDVQPDGGLIMKLMKSAPLAAGSSTTAPPKHRA